MVDTVMELNVLLSLIERFRAHETEGLRSVAWSPREGRIDDEIAMCLEQFENLLMATLRGSLMSLVPGEISQESIVMVAVLHVDVHHLF